MRVFYQSIRYFHNPLAFENVIEFSCTEFDELFVLIGEESAKPFDVRQEYSEDHNDLCTPPKRSIPNDVMVFLFLHFM